MDTLLRPHLDQPSYLRGDRHARGVLLGQKRGVRLYRDFAANVALRWVRHGSGGPMGGRAEHVWAEVVLGYASGSLNRAAVRGSNRTPASDPLIDKARGDSDGAGEDRLTTSSLDS